VGLLNITIGAVVFCPGILLIPQAPFLSVNDFQNCALKIEELSVNKRNKVNKRAFIDLSFIFVLSKF
jgi:hypothetical protein